MASFFEELKRRNVVRVGMLYAVAGWLLLQVADVLFGVMELPGWSLRFVVALLILGFPMALIFAWVFEMTPDGLKLEKDIDRSESITPQTGRKIDRLITVGAVLVVIALVGERFLFDRPAPVEAPATAETAAEPGTEAEPAVTAGAPPNSIAVLPFVNMSGDEDNEYFSDGLTEELLNLLAKIEALRVSSRTSSFTYKGKDVSIPTVASDLNVANILEGSVRKAGSQVRITAQLIDVATDTHLWSDTYDRELDDIFAIQDEIAGAVVDALKVELLNERGIEVANTSRPSTDAYLLYLRGRHTYTNGLDEAAEVNRAKAIFESALEAEPDYALAYAGLADVAARLAIIGELTDEEGYEQSRELALKALTIDPDLVEAHLALADVQLEWDWDVEAADASYRRALAIRPGDADGLRSYAYHKLSIGEWDESIELYKRTIEIDPLQRRAYSGLARSLTLAGYIDEALAIIDRAAGMKTQLGLDDDSIVGLQQVARLYGRRYAEIVELLPEDPAPDELMDAVIAHHHLGNLDESAENLAKLEPLVEQFGAWPTLAMTYAQIGRIDDALDIFDDKIFAERPVVGLFWRTEPLAEPLFGNPRFNEILVKNGIAPTD